MTRSNPTSVLVLLLVAVPASAQVSVFPADGLGVQMTARIEPGSMELPSGVITGTGGRSHRVVPDRNQRRYFAYDLVVEPKDGSQAWQVRVEPFSLPATQVGQLVDPSWTFVPLLKFPVVPDVRAGDTVAIDLLQNPATRQKVVDYLVFTRSDLTRPAERGPLRDISLEDVQMQFENVRISLNGAVLDASTRLGGSISGSAFWFYLPDKGRFVMSLLPNAKFAFRRAGEVSERALTFMEGGDRFQVESSSRIVPAPGRFNVYVFHDPKWRPKKEEPLIVGAAGARNVWRQSE